MKIKVDYGLCCGSAMCTSIAPDYFELDAAGKLRVLKIVVAEEDGPLLDDAVNCCPTEAIELVEEDE